MRPRSHQIGPYSTLTKLDNRTREARLLRSIEAQLFDHCGGSPSVTQKLLIGRTARDLLTLELLDAKLTNGAATEYDIRAHGAISNRVRLALRELGWKGAAQRTPSLGELFGGRAA